MQVSSKLQHNQLHTLENNTQLSTGRTKHNKTTTTKKQDIEKILYKKETSRGAIIPDFKLYYNAIAKKTSLYGHTNKQVDQWNLMKY